MKKHFATMILLLAGCFSFALAQSWKARAFDQIPNNYGVYSISAVNDTVVWAVAWNRNIGTSIPFNHYPYVLRSIDGGETWQSDSVLAAQGRISFDIFGISADTAFITAQDYGNGFGRALYKTEDGGSTWNLSYLGTHGGVWVRFLNQQDGVIINRGSIATTSNQGDTWQIVPDSLIPDFAPNEFTIISSGNGGCEVVDDHVWFNTDAGRIFRSKDKGNSWEAFPTPFGPTALISSIAFKDTLLGIALNPSHASISNFAVTTDGGENWTLQPSNLTEGIRNLAYVPGTDSTLIGTSAPGNNGQRSVISYDWGKTWTKFSTTSQFTALDFYSDKVGWTSKSEVLSSDEPAIYQFKTCNSVDSSVFVTACNSYTWPVNGETYTTNENVTILKPTPEGCDSIFSLGLIITPLQNDIDVQDATLTSNPSISGSSFQWLNCSDGYSVIPNETNQTFTPTENGEYAVEISNFFCVDTSACIAVCFPSEDSIILSGDSLMVMNDSASYQWLDCNNGSAEINGATSRIFVPEIDGLYSVVISGSGCSDTLACREILTSVSATDMDSDIRFFPNPASDWLFLNGKLDQVHHYELFNTMGQLIQTGELTGNKISLEEIPTGLYLITVFDRQQKVLGQHNLIKQ